MSSLIEAIQIYHEEVLRFVKSAELLANYYHIAMPAIPQVKLDLSNPGSIYDQAAYWGFMADWTETLAKVALKPRIPFEPAPAAPVDGSKLPPITGTLNLDLSSVRTN